MTNSPDNVDLSSPWPHRLAVLLVCATFPLIWIGGLVTTYKAGMAVPDWPTTFGYNPLAYPLETWLYGPWNVFIEHGHRLFAGFVILLTIPLVVVLWRIDSRRWMRFMGLAVLACVLFQAVLGGMRVVLDERTLAMIHACVGPAFFALAVALAVFTSRRWREAAPRESAQALGLQGLAWLATAIAYVQLLLGAQLRHISLEAPPSTFRTFVALHLLGAAIVAVASMLLAGQARRRYRDESAIAKPARRLFLLVAAQIALGSGTWVMKYNWPAFMTGLSWASGNVSEPTSVLASVTTTAHVAIGSLILVTALTVALRSSRLLKSLPRLVRLSTSLEAPA